mmetsp:Transcript_2366/g.7547  ORF Transcript_2366/g.7547 Transcript_2366/m.7547 type:complete len:228 (-) Transcript_2366:8-691(-)
MGWCTRGIPQIDLATQSNRKNRPFPGCRIYWPPCPSTFPCTAGPTTLQKSPSPLKRRRRWVHRLHRLPSRPPSNPLSTRRRVTTAPSRRQRRLALRPQERYSQRLPTHQLRQCPRHAPSLGQRLRRPQLPGGPSLGRRLPRPSQSTVPFRRVARRRQTRRTARQASGWLAGRAPRRRSAECSHALGPSSSTTSGAARNPLCRLPPTFHMALARRRRPYRHPPHRRRP